MKRVQKSIYFRDNKYEVRLNRQSIGGQYMKQFATLEEAIEHLDILNNKYELEPKTGMYNNAIRGGIISPYIHYYHHSAELRRSTTFVCNRCDKEFPIKKLNVHHIDHNWDNDSIDNFETLCTYCHRAHHNERDANGQFNQSSETIPNGSTLQVYGSGSGVQSND